MTDKPRTHEGAIHLSKFLKGKGIKLMTLVQLIDLRLKEKKTEHSLKKKSQKKLVKKLHIKKSTAKKCF